VLICTQNKITTIGPLHHSFGFWLSAIHTIAWISKLIGEITIQIYKIDNKVCVQVSAGDKRHNTHTHTQKQTYQFHLHFVAVSRQILKPKKKKKYEQGGKETKKKPPRNRETNEPFGFIDGIMKIFVLFTRFSIALSVLYSVQSRSIRYRDSSLPTTSFPCG